MKTKFAFALTLALSIHAAHAGTIGVTVDHGRMVALLSTRETSTTIGANTADIHYDAKQKIYSVRADMYVTELRDRASSKGEVLLAISARDCEARRGVLNVIGSDRSEPLPFDIGP